MSNTPAKTDDPTSSVPALPDDMLAELVAMSAVDLTPSEVARLTPAYKISGPETNTFKVPALFATVEDETTTEINGTALAGISQRVRWEPGTSPGSGNPPTCRSHDARTGSGEYTNGEVRDCGTCPAEKWTGPEGNQTKPECALRLAFLVDVDEHGPAIMDVPTGSVDGARALTSALMAAASPSSTKPTFTQQRVRITRGDKVTTKGGTTHRPVVIAKGGLATPEQQAHAADVGLDVVRQFRTAREHVADSAGAESVADSGPQEV